jgi:hypothetical protein
MSFSHVYEDLGFGPTSYFLSAMMTGDFIDIIKMHVQLTSHLYDTLTPL